MIFNFKKVASILASAVMLSSTMGFAAAASYPEPFVTSGTADGAVVYGVNAAMSDLTASIDAQENLQALVTSGGTGETSVAGTAWQVETSSDKLEMGESIKDIVTYISDADLSLLADGTISNEKGTATYEQFMYFEDTTSSMVVYEENTDDDTVGDFFKVDSDMVIARYVIDFTSSLKSDVVSDTYEDIEDEAITILGKEYVVTKAINSSSVNSDLTLMSGASKGTVSNDEPVTIGGREVSVIVSGTNTAQFTVDGETTNELSDGDAEPLADETYLGVTDITYQDFAGGIMQATIYLGADKLFIDDQSSLQVNADTISAAACTVTETFASNDVTVTQIAINLTAEDDLYVPADGKLSAASDLDEPEVLLTQNWDIEFKGFETVDTENFKINPTGSDKKYEVTFTNYDGDTVKIPILFTNNSGTYGGDKESRRLILKPGDTGSIDNQTIGKNDYFILNTADPIDSTSGARSYLIQYKGADKVTDDNPKAKFDVVGIKTGVEMTLATAGTFSLTGYGGATFNFINTSTGVNSNFDIRLDGEDYADGANATSVCAYARTQYNALINITDLNLSNENNVHDGTNADWIVTLTMDDTNRDGDDYVLTSAEETIKITMGNASDADVTATVVINGSEVTDPDNSDLSKIRTNYGIYVENTDPTDSPATITAVIPDGAMEPLVYITSGVVTVTPGSGGGGQVLIVKDSEVSSVSGKNLFVVGGSCINTVAAKILDSDVPLCDADFTTATEAGAGQYIIKVVASPYDATKIAMLVAGYEAAETELAVAKAMEGVASDVGSSQVYPITTTAT